MRHNEYGNGSHCRSHVLQPSQSKMLATNSVQTITKEKSASKIKLLVIVRTNEVNFYFELI